MKNGGQQSSGLAGSARQVAALNHKIERVRSQHAEKLEKIEEKRTNVDHKRLKSDSKDRRLRKKVELLVLKTIKIVGKSDRFWEKVDKIRAKSS